MGANGMFFGGNYYTAYLINADSFALRSGGSLACLGEIPLIIPGEFLPVPVISI